jgi:hypothetical protein
VVSVAVTDVEDDAEFVEGDVVELVCECDSVPFPSITAAELEAITLVGVAGLAAELAVLAFVGVAWALVVGVALLLTGVLGRLVVGVPTLLFLAR